MDKKRGAVRVQPARPVTPVAPPMARRGAEHHKVNLKGHSESWMRNHIEVCKAALIKLLGTPVATMMTVAVLAIALTLFLVALTGIPPLVGWYAKFVTLAAVVQPATITITYPDSPSAW